MRLTAEMSVVCLSICRRTYGRKKIAASIRIRALILHLAASMRITRGSHYNIMYKDKSSLVVEITKSEARRQENLRGRRERDRQRRAEEIAEQREERLARRRERDRASQQPRTTEARHARLDQDRAGHQRRRA